MRFWLTTMLCLLATWSHAQDYSSTAERELLALERVGKLQACETKDLKTLDNMLDDSFVLIDPQGKYYSKADLLDYVKSVDRLQFVTDHMAVRLHGKTAIVTGEYLIKTVVHGKLFVERGRFVDTWVSEKGKWKGVASIDVPSQ